MSFSVKSFTSLPSGYPVSINYRKDPLLPVRGFVMHYLTLLKTSVVKRLDTVPWPVMICHCALCTSLTENQLFSRSYHCIRCIRGTVSRGLDKQVEDILTHYHSLLKLHNSDSVYKIGSPTDENFTNEWKDRKDILKVKDLGAQSDSRSFLLYL